MNDGTKAAVLIDGRISPETSLNSYPGMRQDSNGGRIGFSGFVLDLQRGCLLLQDREVGLRPKTYEVLGYLVRNRGRLVSKDELMKAVWPDVIVTEDSLFQCIAELRRALEGEGQRLIKTVQRRGYRFEAESGSSTDVPPAPLAAVTDKAALTGNVPQEGQPHVPRYADRDGIADLKRIVSLGVLAAMIAIAAALLIHGWWQGAGARPASETPISLVVLPFRSLGVDPQSEIFATGLTVELTSELSGLPGAVVISPATAHALNGPSIDNRQLGLDLNVRYVVQGTVARSDREIRINVQLIEAATGRHVWADRQVREVGQGRAWQDEVVAGIASALNFKLTRLESERALRERPHNPETYDLTTRGWALVYTAKKPENYQSALALFKEALSRDARAANALAGVAWVSALSVLNGWSKSPKEDIAAAKSAADQLLAIEPNHVIAHHVRGACLRFEKSTEAARNAFLTAVSVNPNFANSHAQLGRTQIELGSPEEGIRSIEWAMRLSPRDPNIGHWMANVGMAHLHLERYPEAVTWLLRSHDVATSSPTLLHRAYLVAALALVGRADEARVAHKELQSIRPDVTITSVKQMTRSTNPEFTKQIEHLSDGLRIAGLPE